MDESKHLDRDMKMSKKKKKKRSMDESKHLDRDRVPLSSIEAEAKGEMDLETSKKKKADEIIPNKKKRIEMDPETSSSSEKPKRTPTKKAVLVGLKPPQMMNINSVDVKAQILRMKKHLMEHQGFPEDKIIVIIEDDEDDTKPTAIYIREELYKLVECFSSPGDILFIHLIAYGCSDGRIITPDKKHIQDRFFRSLIDQSVRLGLNLTFISDCLIQPKTHCPCPRTLSPVLTEEEQSKILREFWSNPKLLSQATYVIGYYGFITCTNLTHVDILSLQGEDKTNTKIETTPTPLPSRVILFTPFPCDHNVSPHNVNDEEVSEVVFPPPTGYKHTSYGAFTNSLLDVIEETCGDRVTNLELAQKATVKLGGETPPALSCSHLNHAHAPFVC